MRNRVVLGIINKNLRKKLIWKHDFDLVTATDVCKVENFLYCKYRSWSLVIGKSMYSLTSIIFSISDENESQRRIDR